MWRWPHQQRGRCDVSSVSTGFVLPCWTARAVSVGQLRLLAGGVERGNCVHQLQRGQLQPFYRIVLARRVLSLPRRVVRCRFGRCIVLAVRTRVREPQRRVHGAQRVRALRAWLLHVPRGAAELHGAVSRGLRGRGHGRRKPRRGVCRVRTGLVQPLPREPRVLAVRTGCLRGRAQLVRVHAMRAWDGLLHPCRDVLLAVCALCRGLVRRAARRDVVRAVRCWDVVCGRGRHLVCRVHAVWGGNVQRAGGGE